MIPFSTHYTLESHLQYSHFHFHVQMAKHSSDFHFHSHDFSEIILVLEGRGLHVIGDHNYPIQQGDIFVIHPGLSHGFTNVEGLRLINLMFDLKRPLYDLSLLNSLPGYHQLFTLDPLLRESGNFKSDLNFMEESSEELIHLGFKMVEEYNRGEEGFEGMIQAHFQELIISLSRNHSKEESVKDKSTLPIARAMVFFQEHYRENIKIEDVASVAMITPRHLSRLFQSVLNTTPSEFLRDIRLQKARGLLKDSDRRITEVAELCGFSDGNYFSRIFSEHYGKSPRQYRSERA